MFQKISTLLILAFLVSSTYGQKIIVSGAETNRQLTWDDFTGKADKSSSFVAYTAYKSSWKMRGMQVSGDSVIIDGFEITVELDPKNSWVKIDKATPALLIHEQGHFNMGIIAVKEIMETFRKTKFTQATYREVLRNMISNISRKYGAMEVTYDQETDHSKNVDIQNKWNAFFPNS